MPELADYAAHSRYSDPGPHAPLLAAVPTDPGSLHQAACSVVIHYRGAADQLVPGQDADIDLRWLSDLLDESQRRSAGPLTSAREPAQQLAGCCRDHTLVAIAVLREHGIPARSRVGFSGYFRPGFHHDHVVGEYWDGSRWVRFDPELDMAENWFGFDSHDMATGLGAPFETAAEVWQAHRRDGLDVSSLRRRPLAAVPVRAGVRARATSSPSSRTVSATSCCSGTCGGTPCPRRRRPPSELDRLADEVAELLVAADAGDASAEVKLAERYATDPRLQPGSSVVTLSPTGRVGDADLEARVNRWRA